MALPVTLAKAAGFEVTEAEHLVLAKLLSSNLVDIQREETAQLAERERRLLQSVGAAQ